MKQVTTLALIGCALAILADLWSFVQLSLNAANIDFAISYVPPAAAHLFFHVALLFFFLKLKNSQSQAS